MYGSLKAFSRQIIQVQSWNVYYDRSAMIVVKLQNQAL
jgi:hypothetical protein